MDTKYKADASVADASREFKMQKAHFDSEVNTKVIPLTQIHSASRHLILCVKHELKSNLFKTAFSHTQ